MMIALVERRLWTVEEYHEMVEAGISEYWLVNLIDNTIEVHRRPEGDEYEEMFTVDRSAAVSVVAFPMVTFSVGDIIR